MDTTEVHDECPDLIEVDAPTIDEVHQIRRVASECTTLTALDRSSDVFDWARLSAAGLSPATIVALCDGWLMNEAVKVEDTSPFAATEPVHGHD
jgi:hypothetical protein